MLASLRDKILPLADDTVVLPGHGPPPPSAASARRNPYLARWLVARPAAPTRGL